MQIFVDHLRDPYSTQKPVFSSATNEQWPIRYYEIDVIRKSDVTWVLFARDTITGMPVVIKLLCQCKDTRYNFEAAADRQKCLLEAISRNRLFTQNVYMGLARLFDLDLERGHVSLGPLLKKPNSEILVSGTDYALLMHKLPKETRLDVLLSEVNQFSLDYYVLTEHKETLTDNPNPLGEKESNQFPLKYCVQMLTSYMAHIHTKLASCPLLPPEDAGAPWGSVEQLKRKLLHNFAFVNQALITNKAPEYGDYYKSLKSTFHLLRDDLYHLFERDDYSWYFEQRRKDGYIRYCHGDLKAKNIWIASNKSTQESQKYVSALDAVDFNPIYSHIDILSDFAMLVVDIQARIRSSPGAKASAEQNSFILAKLIVDEYLRLTKQEDDISRAVLAYYLVERAFVSGIVNIIYDNKPLVGEAALEVAELYMQDLSERLQKQQTFYELFPQPSLSVPPV